MVRVWSFSVETLRVVRVWSSSVRHEASLVEELSVPFGIGWVRSGRDFSLVGWRTGPTEILP